MVLQSGLELNSQQENLDLRFSCFVNLMEHQRKMENHFTSNTYCNICNNQRDFLFMGGIINNNQEIASMYFMCSHCYNIINMKDYQKHIRER